VNDASARLTARLRSARPEADLRRLELLEAMLGYLSWGALADGHLSRAEERRIVASLRADLGDEDARLVVALLVEEPDTARAVPMKRWLPTLYARATGCDQAWAEATWRSQDRELLMNELQLRWPTLDDRLRTAAFADEELWWNGDRLQIGLPSALRSVQLAFSQLVSLEAVDPWPCVLIEWEPGPGLDPSRMRVGPSGDPRSFERRVEELFDAAASRVRSPDVVRLGWLGATPAEAERVERWPGADGSRSEGAYRSTPARPEHVQAERGRPSVFGALLEWLASSPSRPFGEFVALAAVTGEHLYVRRRHGRAERFALEALRTRRGDSDAVYVFGRNAEVLLTGRASCSVCSALDDRLAARRRARATPR
jgi:hypothetical protein